jgi:nucleoid-associated protein YgaU
MAAPSPGLQQKYAQLARDAGIPDLKMSEQGGKVSFTGTARYQLDKDNFWNKVKAIPGFENEVAADIKVASTDIYGMYTVQSGDSLSKIAKTLLGDMNRWREIHELNKDTVKNPDLIQAGQTLKIPRQ